MEENFRNYGKNWKIIMTINYISLYIFNHVAVVVVVTYSNFVATDVTHTPPEMRGDDKFDDDWDMIDMKIWEQ
jgi:hypothetical protein